MKLRTWNYYRAPGSLAGLGFTSVKSVTASGPYTVVVTLSHPDASIALSDKFTVPDFAQRYWAFGGDYALYIKSAT